MATRAISDIAYGTYKYDAAAKKPEIVDVVRYPAECVNPPAGEKSIRMDRGRNAGREVQMSAAAL